MNPISKIIALKAGKTLQIFDLDSKQKVASHNVIDDVIFWKWVTSDIIAFVSGGSLYHWKIISGSQTNPEKIFQIHTSLSQAQIINYHIDSTQKWCVLIGVNANNGKISGAMQLFNVDRNVTQPIAGHAATFTQIQLENNSKPSNLFIFASRDENQAKVHVIEVGNVPQNNQPFSKRSGDIFFQPDAAADFPIAVHSDNQSGMFYLLTKSGYMYMYDIESTTCFYATKISQDVIFTSTNTSNFGFVAINRLGLMFSVKIDQNNIVNYLRSKNMDSIAIKLVERCGLPGSESIYFQKFNNLFSQGNYEGAAKMAARAPNNILRTSEIIRQFQNAPTLPGGSSPLLHYFTCLLELGKLNQEESIELCRPVIYQNKKNLIEKWLKEDKLECSQELGDLTKTIDSNLALSIYLRCNASEKVMQCFAETGQYDKILLYAEKVGIKPDYGNILLMIVKSNPDASVDFAKKLVINQEPLYEITKIVDIYMSFNLIKQCTNFLLEALKDDKEEDGILQTRLLEMNLAHAPQVAEAIFERKMFTHYDYKHIAELCERAGLMQRAVEHYTDIYDIKRAIIHTHLFNPEWLIEYFGTLSPEDTMTCLKLLLESNLRQNLQLCTAIASKYSEQLTPAALITLFETVRSSEGLFLYLGQIANFSQDPDVIFKYIQSACKIGQIKEVERICKESNFYDPERVKNFLKESRLQDHLPLIIVCDRFNFVQDLILYLYKQNALNYIEMYVQKVNPTRLPVVVGGLLDVNCSDDFIRKMIIQVPDNYDMVEMVEEVSKRNRIKILLSVLENRISSGSVDPSIHSAMAMVYVDSNISPDRFLKENNYYDCEIVGKFCEKFNPNLAFIAYEKGECNEKIISLCVENKLMRNLGRYLVTSMNNELWTKVLNPNNDYRRALIDQIVQIVLPETQDPELVSFTVKAFMQADLPNELVELLEKLILNNTLFSNHKNLQNLLILTSIKADKKRVLEYITKLDNYDAPDIANIAIENGLFEEAFTIYKKFDLHEYAIGVLLNNFNDPIRAYEYAERCNESMVWSLLARYQLNHNKVNESLNSYIKAGDISNHRDVIRVAKEHEEFINLKQYLIMVKKSLNDSFIDTQYAYCLVRLDELDELNNFVKHSPHVNLVTIGDQCVDEGNYEAARIFFESASNYPKLALVYTNLNNYGAAVECARKANNVGTWRSVCFTSIDKKEFKLAQVCAHSLIINPEELQDVIGYYEKFGYFEELLLMLEAATLLERSHMGLFTELSICYAKYKPEKLKEHLDLFITRVNIPKIIYVTEQYCLWSETVFLYEKYEEYDNALKNILDHPVETYHEIRFRDIVSKVVSVELIYRAAQFYYEQHPLLLEDFLNLVSSKIDPSRIISMLGDKKSISLIKGYLEFIQKLDSKIVNETLNSIYIEEGLYDSLANSVEKYQNFDMIKMAELLENHELIEFRRVANLIYKKCNRWNKSIELAKKDGLDKDAVKYAGESRDPVYALELLTYFTSKNMKEATITLLYHCYDLLKADDVLECCWKNGMIDMCMPYLIQLLSDVVPKISEFGGKIKEQEKTVEQPSIIGGPQLLLTRGNMNQNYQNIYQNSNFGQSPQFSTNNFHMPGSRF